MLYEPYSFSGDVSIKMADWYSLEQKIDGQWYTVTERGQEIASVNIPLSSYSWSILFDTALESGDYRIGKELSMVYTDGKIDTAMYYAEFEIPEQEMVAPAPQPEPSPEPQGVTKVYTYPENDSNGLSFTITQVAGEQEETFVDVGGDGSEYPYRKILYYPGATLTVLSPGYWEGHYQWKLSSTDPTAEPLNITLDMEPIHLADVKTIYHYEGLVPIFSFEAYQGTETAPVSEAAN